MVRSGDICDGGLRGSYGSWTETMPQNGQSASALGTTVGSIMAGKVVVEVRWRVSEAWLTKTTTSVSISLIQAGQLITQIWFDDFRRANPRRQ